VTLLLVLVLRGLEFRLFARQFCIDCTIKVAAGGAKSLESVRRVLADALTIAEPIEEKREEDAIALHVRGCGSACFTATSFARSGRSRACARSSKAADSAPE